MKSLKVVFVIPFCLIVLGGVASATYLHSTIAQYENAAPCYKLKGIPGLLQATHFIANGGCIVDTVKGGCHDSRACEISKPPTGKPKKGKCSPANNGTDCVCVLSAPSPGQ